MSIIFFQRTNLYGFPPSHILFCCELLRFGELVLVCLPHKRFSHCEFSSSLYIVHLCFSLMTFYFFPL